MSADFWAGYISGAASIVVGNPLDVLKVRLQASRTVPSAETINPNTSLAIFKDFSVLVKGLPAPILTYGALNALLFWSYNRTLEALPASLPASSGLAQFTAGAVAGLATFVISAPTELIKCRAQVISSAAEGVPHTSFSIAKDIVRQYGVRGLYFGGVVTSLRDSIGYGFYFWSYELSSAAWQAASAKKSLNASGFGSTETLESAGNTHAGDQLRIFVCGGLAGVVTWLSVFPLDVVKSRMQTQPNIGGSSRTVLASASSSSSSPERGPLLIHTAARQGVAEHVRSPNDLCSSRSHGAWCIAKQMLRHEGASSFFRGLTVCSIRAFVVNAVQWATYEWARARLS